MKLSLGQYGRSKLFEWSGRRRFIYLREIDGNERKERKALEDVQFRKLKKILWHAFLNVPYYSEVFKKLGTTPDDIRSIRDITNLPILTKEVIKNNLSEFKAKNISDSDLLLNHTGGSTGKPLAFFVDREIFETMEAGFLRCSGWAGYQFGDPLAYIWGAQKDLKGLGSLTHRIKSFLNNRYYFGAYKYSPDEMGRWLDFLKRKKITFIYGYASTLSNFSNYIKSKNLEAPKIKAIFTSAETLFPEARKLIEEVFNCKVFDQYGSREVICIACECEKGNMHILTDFVHVEFIKDETSKLENPPCKIIVTSFVNFGTPFIRYEIGDYGSPKEGYCSCGRSFPMMELKIGRMNEHILTRDGRLIYPSYFIHLLDGINGIWSFQFRQVNFDKIDLYVVESSNEGVNRNEVQNIEKRIKSEIDKKISLSIHFVDALTTPLSGKHRYVISDISN